MITPNSEQMLYLVQALERHEGFREKPYKDSEGILTIGFGRNLEDVGISRLEAQMLLVGDIKNAVLALHSAFPWASRLDWPRLYVLINMTFNMGATRLATFRNTLRMIEAGEYKVAAAAMLESKWAKQVGPRAIELAKIMETGVLV